MYTESSDTGPGDLAYALPVTNQTTNDQIFGTRKTFAGLQLVEWSFLVTSVLNLAVCICMSIYRLVVVVETDLQSSPDFTLTILILVNCVFCLFYVIHGVVREKEYEIYMFIGAILFILSYCILEYSINNTGRTPVKLARLIFGCVLAPVNISLAVVVARQFGWLEFKIMGASEALQNMYREVSRYTSLLTFDLQVMVTFILLVLNNGVSMTTGELVTLCVGIPLAAAWCGLGWQAVKKESRCGMMIFFIMGVSGPAYIGYIIYKIYETFTNDTHKSELLNTLLYGSVAAAALSVLMRGLVYIEAVRVTRNFGKGLRERAFEVEANETTSLLAVPRRR